MKNILTYICLIFFIISSNNCNKEQNHDFYELNFSNEQRDMADQIISIFENHDPVIHYDFIGNINDGRGYTAGRAGFTTATCDLLEVVNRYSLIVPNNNLVSFIPELKVVCGKRDSSTAKLAGLPKEWIKAAKDYKFRRVQDEVVDDFYFLPAVKHAQKLGLRYPLSLLNIYDACIQHGDGDDPDGVQAMIAATSKAVYGTPAEGVRERTWLRKFMEIRKTTLIYPYNGNTKRAWAISVNRVDALKKLYDARNHYLDSPLKLEIRDQIFTLVH